MIEPAAVGVPVIIPVIEFKLKPVPARPVALNEVGEALAVIEEVEL